MSTLKIKVCGMTSLQQVEALVQIGADYAGFIFYEKSPRFVGNKIEAAALKVLSGIKKVGVFVNAGEADIMQTVQSYGLDAVQLHGDEAPELCASLKEKITVIKAFRVHSDDKLSEVLPPYENAVDYFLFDTKAQSYGGTGQKFDWSVLEKATVTKPYFLSGGISLDDIELLKSFTTANRVFALDINSKFETAAGIKDIDSVQQLVRSMK